ncbi:hypothetical protein CVIC12175_0198 [Campylobacter vicugnae]|uniref:hypothetical protein n=2 Tax=Campylobacter vicugnae TaxID=1660076 RepID=UPI000A2FBB5F|nr:hypothetical protein [Campylobacter sp. RM12175]ARR03351.1 hypothetical protein CVIC12175_0198 [Campylobacter sp. RM12175]
MNIPKIPFINMLNTWNFDIIDKIYQDKIVTDNNKMIEYVNFLYNTGQIDKIRHIINLLDDEYISTFVGLKELCDIKNIDNSIFNNHLFSKINKDILACVYINYFIKYEELDLKECQELLNKYIVTSNNVVTISYFLKTTIDYFEIFNNMYFNNIHIILHILQNKFKNNLVDGSNYYYNKVLLNYKKYFLNNQKFKQNAKVALLIGGALRGGNWLHTINKNIDEIGLNADVFLFTWDKEYSWIGLGGVPVRWVDRMLPSSLAKSAPQEVATKSNFNKYFPLTYNKLSKEYATSLDRSKLNKIKNLVSYSIENELDFINKYKLKPEWNVCKLHYGNLRLLQILKEYEKTHNKQYDYIIKIRPDIVCKSEYNIESILEINDMEIGAYYGSIGLDDNILVGKYHTMNLYLSLFEISIQNKHLPLFANAPRIGAHDGTAKYCSLLGIKAIMPKITKESFKNISEYIIPDFSKELQEDLSNSNLNEDTLKKCKLFFHSLKNESQKFEIINKDLQIKIIKNNLNLLLYKTAKSRIHNQLSYKLGKAMIENSKSIWGYIRMPYVLSYMKDMHKKEQIAYNEKIKANPSLKLPPLESYPDYKEALKEKECLTYKLGEAMIEASKNWYKGGYVKFIFKAIRLKEKYMKK